MARHSKTVPFLGSLGSLGFLFVGLCAFGQTLPADPAPTTAPAESRKLPFTLSKETTRITSPLLPDGTPDYVGAINEQLSKGVTPENNGFVLWVQLWGDDSNTFAPSIREKTLELCGIKAGPPAAARWQFYETFLKSKNAKIDDATLFADADELEQLRFEPWVAADHPRPAEFIQTHEQVLNFAREAAARPKYWCPYVSRGDSMSGAMVPGLGTARDIGDVLCARAMLEMQAGDFDNFAADVLAAKRLARQISAGGHAIYVVWGASFDRVANGAIGNVVGSGKLTQEQCGKLSKMLDALPPLASFADVVDTWERYALLECMLVLSRNDVRLSKLGDEELFRDLQNIDRDRVDWDAALKYANQNMDDVVAYSRAPTFQLLQAGAAVVNNRQQAWKVMVENYGGDSAPLAKKDFESREAYTARVAQTIMVSALPNLDSGEELCRRPVLQNEMLHALLAAAGERAATGQWPGKLEALVPKQLKQIPIDFYGPSEKSLVQYRVTDGHAMIYSVGRNGVFGEGRYDDVAVGVVPHPKLP